MSIDPQIWGPHAWFLMYSVAMTYPHCPKEEDKKNTKLFYSSLGGVLPCIACRNNFKKHIRVYPLTSNALSNRVNLINWVININNEVNKLIGAPPITYEDTVDKYTNLFHGRSEINTKHKSYMFYSVMTFIIILCIIFMRKQIRGALSKILDR